MPASTNHGSPGAGLGWLAPVLLASLLALLLSAMASFATNVSLIVALAVVGGLSVAIFRRLLFQVHELKSRKDRLKSLYAFSNFLADANQDSLFGGINDRVCDLMGADAIGLRLCGLGETAFSMLIKNAACPLTEAEHVLAAGAQALATLMSDAPTRPLLLDENAPAEFGPCASTGMRSLVYIPVRSQQRLLAEIVLCYRLDVVLDDDRNELISAVSRHLAIVLETNRARVLARETAISAERHFIARELHDSIAQSLGFLKIQIHLLRKAIDKNDQNMAAFVLAELDAGLANSIADVRELLVHFRTRTDSGEIGTAIQETLQKFQNQSGLKANFSSSGHSPELAPDVQIQVLNVLQEALSNVRKHAQASHVDIEMVRGQTWRLLVRDNGKGFDANADKSYFNVGLNIMRERADMIGATFNVESAEGSGTTVTLAVPLNSMLRPGLHAHTSTAASPLMAAHAPANQPLASATHKT